MASPGVAAARPRTAGEILDACLGQLAMRGRVVLCGAIATYNDRGSMRGPANYRSLIIRRGRMEGFIIIDYLPRFGEFFAEMAPWLMQGKIKYDTTIVKGIENSLTALDMLLTGGNTGKLLIQVSEEKG